MRRISAHGAVRQMRQILGARGVGIYIARTGAAAMSMHAMLMGTLVADPVRRTGQSGKPFVTGTMRVPCEGAEPFLASLIAFSATAAEALAQHGKGDTVVVGGRANLKSWQGRDGTERHGLGVVVEQVMSEYSFSKRRKAAAGAEDER